MRTERRIQERRGPGPMIQEISQGSQIRQMESVWSRRRIQNEGCVPSKKGGGKKITPNMKERLIRGKRVEIGCIDKDWRGGGREKPRRFESFCLIGWAGGNGIARQKSRKR